MATLNRLRVAWTGPAGITPGVTTFFFSGTMTGKPAAVVTLFDSLKAIYPTGVSWSIPSAGDTLEDSTGTLTGGWAASGGSTVNATGVAEHAAGVGMRAVLETGNVHLGRRVRGAIFKVPLIATAYDSTGTILNTTITASQSAWNTFLSAVTPDWRVWSRPNQDGAFAVSTVTAVSLPDKVATLRSRRT